MLTPNTIEELAETVRSEKRVIAVGAGTKPRLSQVDAVRVATTRLAGITEYDPSEFTFTALAGTPVKEIEDTLAERGQHLPFDPMLVDAGATIGGTVASGLNGPGRLRFGGIRDFILGVRFVDGNGRLLRMGGKVVKNAAGFDLPKFFVGSLGRFGALAEVTFKVFPAPTATTTLELSTDSRENSATILRAIPRTRLEPRALEYDPHTGFAHLLLGGPPEALDPLADEVLATWPGRLVPEDAAHPFWRDLHEFAWAHDGGTLIKLVFGADRMDSLDTLLEMAPESRIRVSAGGDVAFVSIPAEADSEALPSCLRKLEIAALTLWGNTELFPGAHHDAALAHRIKAVLDPANRFPPIGS